jgi:hypothetical protein
VKKRIISGLVSVVAVLGIGLGTEAFVFPSGSVTITQDTKTVHSTTRNGVTTTTTCEKKIVNGVVVINGCTTTTTTH